MDGAKRGDGVRIKKEQEDERRINIHGRKPNLYTKTQPRTDARKNKVEKLGSR